MPTDDVPALLKGLNRQQIVMRRHPGRYLTAVVLHLSDIHIRSDKDWILDKGSSIAACVFSSLPDATTVFVIVSGDIAFSGKPTQYAAAEGLFIAVRSAIQTEK
ncbi:MAG: hypothetical protein H0U56_01710 [Methylibium sp.]|uniref:hypothetical protein n=1 Tax=Methylibium sp. TaxID=2067992 RepID=UPI00183A9814|nr:hypothetical protein [Methylibium sp.]MBA2721615.1 hypothetical protein [Methylibium sp.]MBA3592048.1 hypothetical protein [Methylibium sp.]